MAQTRAIKLPVAIAGFACLVGIASAPAVMSSFGAGTGITLPGVAAAERLMAMLDARSPGERAPGALTQSKPRTAATSPSRQAPPKPGLEQLARVIVPAPPAPPVQDVVPVLPVVPPTAADVIAPTALTASVPFGSGGGFIVGGGAPATGGGGGGGGSPPTGEVPPGGVTSPVPEPGTWLMMLVGFGIIGSALPSRRRRRLALSPAA